MQEKLSAYDRINNRFKKLSGGQSLEDRAAYYKKEAEKGKKKLDQFRKDNNYNEKSGKYEMYSVYEMFKKLINPIQESTEPFDILTTKLKGMLENMEGGNTRLAYYAAAHLMLNEDWEDKSEQEINQILENFADYVKIYRLDNFKRGLEEMPTNAMGSGAIAGAGVNGPDDVKVSKKARKKYKSQNKIDAENYHQGIQQFVNMKFNGFK